MELTRLRLRKVAGTTSNADAFSKFVVLLQNSISFVKDSRGSVHSWNFMERDAYHDCAIGTGTSGLGLSQRLSVMIEI